MDEPAPPKLHVHHLAVQVVDLARAERFWVDVLGLAVTHRYDDAEGRPRSFWLALGGDAFLAVERATSTDTASTDTASTDAAPGWHCVALGIAPHERASWRARLIAHGVPIERESPFTLYVRDPEGALVALSHYPHPA